MKESITIKFPVSYTPKQFEELQALNKEVKIKPNKKGNQVTFYESAFPFEEVSFFHLHLPPTFKITEEEFEEICNANKNAKLEFDNNNKITINMLTLELISLFTGFVFAVLLAWARQRGKVLTETARFNLRDKKGHLKIKAADVAYISFESAKQSGVQPSNFVEIPPDLILEIVSAPEDEKKEIDKVRKDWLEGGAKVGVVVNPYKKKYYVFEQGDIGYEIYDFSTPFTHYLFPSLLIDFDILLSDATYAYNNGQK